MKLKLKFQNVFNITIHSINFKAFSLVMNDGALVMQNKYCVYDDIVTIMLNMDFLKIDTQHGNVIYV
jgi:hypothetical protein